MARAVQTLHWDQTSLIWATLANANRDHKSHPKPFSPADVHPLRSAKDYESADDDSGAPDWALIQKIRKQYKTTVIHGLKVD